MKNTKKVNKAKDAIRRELSAPGHKEELRAYNEMMRGERIRGTRRIDSKKDKAKSRSNMKRMAKREIGEYR